VRACLRREFPLMLALAFPCGHICAQQAVTVPLGTIENFSPAQNLQISGPMNLQGTTLLLGNGSAITAGAQTLHIARPQGAELDLCPTTQVRLTQAVASLPADGAHAQAAPLLIALDHGALEDHTAPGAAPDVLLTPDLRIALDSGNDGNGTGTAAQTVSIRVNRQGDTCVDNGHGQRANAHAAAIDVNEMMGAGVYRIRPGQRVLFERGSVESVVDNEPEPCGCPAISIASTGVTSTQNVAQPGQAVAANAFPLAQSEELAPTPAPATPAASAGQTHMQIATTLSYSGSTNRVSSPATEAATSASDPAPPTIPAAKPVPAGAAASAVTAQASPSQQKQKHASSLLHHIGHFFKKIFGKG
jgi:hypothetical protein